MEACSDKTCDMDGYHPSASGVTEYYWHCEELAVARLNDGLLLCKKHLDLWNEGLTGA